MSHVMALRSEYKESFEKKHGVRLGFMGFFVKACIAALKELPNVNAELEGDDVVYKNYYDMGVAVSTEKGLVVPVVRDADRLSLAGIEAAINDFGLRARDGKLKLDELQGGTFTISNGGVFGSLMSTPILNSPQSGILGMHKIQPRPIAIDNKVEIRPMMYLALSYDHRLVDGREAVTFPGAGQGKPGRPAAAVAGYLISACHSRPRDAIASRGEGNPGGATRPFYPSSRASPARHGRAARSRRARLAAWGSAKFSWRRPTATASRLSVERGMPPASKPSRT